MQGLLHRLTSRRRNAHIRGVTATAGTCIKHAHQPAALHSFHASVCPCAHVQWAVIIRHAYSADPGIIAAMREDLAAISERDPACKRLVHALLYFKGFQVQCVCMAFP